MSKATKIIAQIATGASAAVVLAAGKAMALTSVEEGAEAARADGMPAELVGDNGVFNRLTNTVLMVVGLISVIMLVYGGLRYITSGGDSKKVTDAKNTILYAIIGLIICVLAYAIVTFVLSTIGATTATPAEG
jgi:cytochrome bd-type quinol oxidase subunit 2